MLATGRLTDAVVCTEIPFQANPCFCRHIRICLGGKLEEESAAILVCYKPYALAYIRGGSIPWSP